MRRLRWEILAMMGDIARERGDEAEATALYAQAREILQYIIDHTPTELRTFFLNLPNVRHVMRTA